ncbi:hypothetical protein N0K21_11240 [Yersinia aleksiciae]|uniref:hypothetical protein n=1 Tax=Yersinia aleksiciae TaxID=263819 RepID=UPI002E1505F9|nr:hypothetical protein N0K21_11240 [Yersinia aleksiciae]
MTNHSERTSNAKHPNSTKSANEKERFYNEKSEKISEIIGCIASTIEILIEKKATETLVMQCQVCYFCLKVVMLVWTK